MAMSEKTSGVRIGTTKEDGDDMDVIITVVCGDDDETSTLMGPTEARATATALNAFADAVEMDNEGRHAAVELASRHPDIRINGMVRKKIEGLSFAEAVEAMLAGKWVRLPRWDSPTLCIGFEDGLGDYRYMVFSGGPPRNLASFHHEEVARTDWMIVS